MASHDLAPTRRRKRKAGAPMRLCLGCDRSTGTVWKWLCDACFGRLPYLRKKEICDARAARDAPRIFGLSRAAAGWIAEQRNKAGE